MQSELILSRFYPHTKTNITVRGYGAGVYINDRKSRQNASNAYFGKKLLWKSLIYVGLYLKHSQVNTCNKTT